jgi:2-amino-4-hydroxy-6-hydroxymethyldihydropteridine diphosphokinase
MIRVFISLGSNLQGPLQQVKKAAESIRQLPETSVVAVSRWYQSKAVGPGQQPDYVNGVIGISTSLTPSDLLLALHTIEDEHDRLRTVRWGPRTLDLDILLYGDAVIDEPHLTIPHPRMLTRNFVLHPLCDIDPELIFPDGNPLQNHIKECSWDNLYLVDDS